MGWRINGNVLSSACAGAMIKNTPVAPLLGWRINGNGNGIAVLANAVKSSPLYWGGELMETFFLLSCVLFYDLLFVAPLLGWRINGNTK